MIEDILTYFALSIYLLSGQGVKIPNRQHIPSSLPAVITMIKVDCWGPKLAFPMILLVGAEDRPFGVGRDVDCVADSGAVAPAVESERLFR